MSEPITKELRLYAGRMLSEYSPILFHIKELCDNIDSIHASLEQENERLRNASERGNDWPLDADGVAWNICDRDENGHKVTSLKLTKSGWFYFANSMPHVAGEHRHYRPDTWESIISDAMRAGRADVTVDVMPLIKRCKALCERTRDGE